MFLQVSSVCFFQSISNTNTKTSSQQSSVRSCWDECVCVCVCVCVWMWNCVLSTCLHSVQTLVILTVQPVVWSLTSCLSWSSVPPLLLLRSVEGQRTDGVVCRHRRAVSHVDLCTWTHSSLEVNEEFLSFMISRLSWFWPAEALKKLLLRSEAVCWVSSRVHFVLLRSSWSWVMAASSRRAYSWWEAHCRWTDEEEEEEREEAVFHWARAHCLPALQCLIIQPFALLIFFSPCLRQTFVSGLCGGDQPAQSEFTVTVWGHNELLSHCHAAVESL